MEWAPEGSVCSVSDIKYKDPNWKRNMVHGCVGMSVCLMEVEELIGLSGEGVACTRHNHRNQGQVRQETRRAVEFRVP